MANVANPTAPGPVSSRLGIVPRVFLFTFGLTGIAFAVSLFLGILGMAVVGIFRGHLPDMRLAYRLFALPVAMVAGAAAFVGTWILEIRHFHRAKMLISNDLEPKSDC